MDITEFQQKQEAFNGEVIIFKAETEGSLASIHQRLGTMATKEDTALIVEQVIRDIIKESGKRGYAGLLIAAGIIGALVVIGGGAKALLGWIGFNYIR